MMSRAQLYRYRGNKCAHCGMCVEEMVARYGTFNRMFEFHHIDPNTKHRKYKQLMARKISAEQIEEVDKCILLCRECHGVVHAQDNNGILTVDFKIEDRVVTQTLHGWYVSDCLEQTIKFISNEKFWLRPCLVRLGDQVEKKFCILELMQHEILIGWFSQIKSYKRIQIRAIDTHKLLLEVLYIKGRQVNIRMALGFPIFSMNFDVENGGCSYLWMRNGIVLTNEGEVINKGLAEFPLTLHPEVNSDFGNI